MDWKNMEHAYGSASDIPDKLEALRRGAAHDDLAAAIVHQGTVYPPAYHAVAPLAEMLERDENVAEVLKLLAAIAIGQTYLSPKGFKEPKLPKSPKGAALPRACYHAVKALVPRVRALLAHDASEARTAAAFLLAWYPSEATASGEALARAFAKEEDSAARASIALALGCLAPSGAAELLARVTPNDALARDAFAIALAMLKKPNDDLATAARAKPYAGFPWGDGSLADLAVDLLGSAKGGKKLDGLLAATAAGNEEGALKLIAHVFPSKELGPEQRRAIEALLDGEVFTCQVNSALEKRGLPATVSALEALAGRTRARATALDDVVSFRGASRPLREHLVDAVKSNDQSALELADATLAQLPAERAVSAAIDVDEFLGIRQVGAPFDRAIGFALRVVARAAANAPGEVLAADARIRKAGPGKKDNPFGGTMDCQYVSAVVGVGLAHAALAKGELVSERVQKMIFGLDREEIATALAAFPPEARDKWLIKQDGAHPPCEDVPSVWVYFSRWPSPAITEHVIRASSKWKPKDPWGRPREKHADPYVRRYAEALRARGNEVDAARVLKTVGDA